MRLGSWLTLPLRALAPWIQRVITPQRLVQQALLTGTSAFSLNVMNPLVIELFGGNAHWLPLTQSLLSTGIVGLLGTIPIYGLMPLGGVLQNRGALAGDIVGHIAIVGLETLYSIVGYQALAPIFHWDRNKAFYAALWQGPSRAVSTALIYRRWSREGIAGIIARQTTMMLMVTNSSVVTTLASSKDHELSGWDMGEIAAFNLLIAGIVVKLPA